MHVSVTESKCNLESDLGVVENAQAHLILGVLVKIP